MEMINCKLLILKHNSHKYGLPRARGGTKLSQGPQCGWGDERVGGALGPLVLPQPDPSHQSLFWLFQGFNAKEKEITPDPF